MRFHKLEESIINRNATIGYCKPADQPRASFAFAGLLKEAQKFYCGELRDLPRMKDYAEYPLLPFAAVCFEYEGDNLDDGRRLSHFCLAWEGGKPNRPDISMIFFTRYPEACGFIGMVTFTRSTAVLEIKNPIDMQSPAQVDEGERLMRNHFERIGDFLAVLNCANVTTETVDAPAALNKKRTGSGKPPIYSYKTLVLKSSVARHNSLGGTHDSPRIHLRRGHIKHRKTGDFWWQPCVVGDRTRGVVMKDYRADKLVSAGA